MSTTLDLELTTYAAKVAEAIVAVEKDLSTDYHLGELPIYIAGEKTIATLVPNDVSSYDLKVEDAGE